jgi:hypothetical protein
LQQTRFCALDSSQSICDRVAGQRGKLMTGSNPAEAETDRLVDRLADQDEELGVDLERKLRTQA